MTLKFKHYATGEIIEVSFSFIWGELQIFKDKNDNQYYIEEDREGRTQLKGTSYFLIE